MKFKLKNFLFYLDPTGVKIDLNKPQSEVVDDIRKEYKKLAFYNKEHQLFAFENLKTINQDFKDFKIEVRHY